MVAAANRVPASILIVALLPTRHTEHDPTKLGVTQSMVGEQARIVHEPRPEVFAPGPLRDGLPIGIASVFAQRPYGAGFPVGEHNGLVAGVGVGHADEGQYAETQKQLVEFAKPHYLPRQFATFTLGLR